MRVRTRHAGSSARARPPPPLGASAANVAATGASAGASTCAVGGCPICPATSGTMRSMRKAWSTPWRARQTEPSRKLLAASPCASAEGRPFPRPPSTMRAARATRRGPHSTNWGRPVAPALPPRPPMPCVGCVLAGQHRALQESPYSSQRRPPACANSGHANACSPDSGKCDRSHAPIRWDTCSPS